MPDYEHICTNEECKHEWEDTYSINKEPPKECPKCHKQTAKRVISLNSKGIVELSGQELVNKVKSDARELSRNAAKKEKVYANLLGEDKYHQMQTSMDRRKR